MCVSQEGHENSAMFEVKISELQNDWRDLRTALDAKKGRLSESEKAHQVDIPPSLA